MSEHNSINLYVKKRTQDESLDDHLNSLSYIKNIFNVIVVFILCVAIKKGIDILQINLICMLPIDIIASPYQLRLKISLKLLKYQQHNSS